MCLNLILLTLLSTLICVFKKVRFDLYHIFRNHLLQADSDTLCNAWMRALQRTIHYLHENDDTVFQLTTVKQINDGTPEYALALHHESLLAELRRIPGNDVCADCCVESPKWASINLGVS